MGDRGALRVAALDGGEGDPSIRRTARIAAGGDRASGRFRLPRLAAGVTPRRRLYGAATAVVLLPALTAVLSPLRDTLNLTSDVLLFLLAVVAVALVGGLWPALAAAVAAFLLLNWFFTEPTGRLAIAGRNNALALAVFAAVAVLVSGMVDLAARRTSQAARATAAVEPLAAADRTRTALLAAVSHDLRSPLAAAKAAVSGLRGGDVRLREPERAELLATADESLDRLTRLVENLLDLSRLQAGALPVFPQPVGLEDVLPAVLRELEPVAVESALETDLPEVMADPGLLERILVNVGTNAVRHSPPGRPPRITASAHQDRVEVRVIDVGPGVPEADWDRIFVPFQRLGDRDTGTGVGLGLALSRGLAEAMRGSLRPDNTPGGGLTMVLSLPIVPVPGRVRS